LKKQRPLFDKEYLRFLDERKKVNMQWLQDPNLRNLHKLNNVRCEVSSRFREKNKYMKAKIDDLEINSKIKNKRDFYREINNLK
jgi:hypothetical protein